MSYLRLLADRDLRLVWIGQVTSQFGDACYEIAMVWLVLTLTGQDYFSVGVVIFARMAPYILIGPIAGVYVDRWDRRRTMIVCDLLRGLAVLLVPLLYLLGALEVWHVAAAAFVLTTCRTFFNPALNASLPAIVRKPSLVGANALIQASGQAAMIIGPAAAGLALTVMSADALFVLDGLTFFVSAGSIALLGWRPGPREPAAPTTMRAELADTVAVVYRTKPAFWSAVLFAVGLLTISGTYRVGLAALAATGVGGGSAGYGLLTAALGVGTVLGALVVGRLRPRVPTRVVFAGWAVWGLCFATMGLTGSLLLALAIAVVSGVGESAATVFTTSLLQSSIPPELLGKTFALWSLLCSSGESLSGVAVGYGLAQLDPRLVFAIAGGVTVAVAGFGWLVTERAPAPLSEPAEESHA
jgi:DHA3 family macrolide efflux protein-like MFS transporter